MAMPQDLDPHVDEIGSPHDGRGQATPPARIDLWGTRTTSSGAFPEAKHSGDVLRGAKRED